MIDTTTQIHQIENIFNVGIPFLYKRYDTEFACIPGLTYVRTLASNGVMTVGELYDGSREEETWKYLKLLQDAPSYEWSSLKTALSAQFVSFFSSRGLKLSNALDNMYCIMSKGDGKVSEDSTFHEMLSALPDYFKGGSLESRIRDMVKEVLNARNRTIGHAETAQDKTAASIKECVINVLSVTIYISSKL